MATPSFAHEIDLAYSRYLNLLGEEDDEDYPGADYDPDATGKYTDMDDIKDTD